MRDCSLKLVDKIKGHAHRKGAKNAKKPQVKVLKYLGFFRVFRVFRGGNTKIILSGNLAELSKVPHRKGFNYEHRI